MTLDNCHLRRVLVIKLYDVTVKLVFIRKILAVLRSDDFETKMTWKRFGSFWLVLHVPSLHKVSCIFVYFTTSFFARVFSALNKSARKRTTKREQKIEKILHFRSEKVTFYFVLSRFINMFREGKSWIQIPNRSRIRHGLKWIGNFPAGPQNQPREKFESYAHFRQVHVLYFLLVVRLNFYDHEFFLILTWVPTAVYQSEARGFLF